MHFKNWPVELSFMMFLLFLGNPVSVRPRHLFIEMCFWETKFNSAEYFRVNIFYGVILTTSEFYNEICIWNLTQN